jgi:hypothetical protein
MISLTGKILLLVVLTTAVIRMMGKSAIARLPRTIWSRSSPSAPWPLNR